MLPQPVTDSARSRVNDSGQGWAHTQSYRCCSHRDLLAHPVW